MLKSILQHLKHDARIVWKLGELAQLVECCDRTAEVRGSSLLFSIWILVNVKNKAILALFLHLNHGVVARGRIVSTELDGIFSTADTGREKTAIELPTALNTSTT